MNIGNFFENPIKHFQDIIKMKSEDAEILFKKLNAELAILIGEEKKKQEELKKKKDAPPKQFPLPPNPWI